MIDRVAYDDDRAILSVTFHGTGKYLYYDVPAAMFEALCKVPSAGSVFNERIKGHLRFRRDPERRRFGPGEDEY